MTINIKIYQTAIDDLAISMTMTLFFWTEHSPPTLGYVPQNQNFPKTESFFGKIGLNLHQKKSKAKGNCFEHPLPPAYVPQICQKTKVIPLRLRYTAPETEGCDPSVNRFLQVYLYFVGMTTKPFKPARHRTKTISVFITLYGFCLTFTANLSKKIHAKNLKIFFKKLFLQKNLFLGYEKRGILGEGKFQEKMFSSKKKRHI